MTVRGQALPAFRRKLLGWFREYRRDLPWRHTNDPYRIWVSEIMLQQTRVAAVIPYYERFLDRFPDVRTLAAAPEAEVLRLWSGLGYYSRARNLQRAAQQMVARHGGIFPRAHKDVLALSGIGDYTAAAILSIGFAAKYAVVDGNVARVLARIFALRGDLREARRWQDLQTRADTLLDARMPGDWNQAMMELGATICTPRSPQCLLCPVARFCQAHKLGLAESIPARRIKRAVVDVVLVAAVIVDAKQRCLLLSPGPSTAGIPAHDDVPTLVSRMWHFPTLAGPKGAAMDLRAFLLRMAPKWPIDHKSFSLDPLPKVRHTVTYRRITVFPFRIRIQRWPRLRDGKIVPLSDLASGSSLAVSNLTRKVARAATVVTDLSFTETTSAVREGTLFALSALPGSGSV